MDIDKQLDPNVMKNRANKQEIREFCDPNERGQRREVIKHLTEGGIETFIREYPNHAPDYFCVLLMCFAIHWNYRFKPSYYDVQRFYVIQ